VNTIHTDYSIVESCEMSVWCVCVHAVFSP